MTAAARTLQPSTMSSSWLSSEKSWLIPPIDGMNSIAAGSNSEIIAASWYAPLGISIQLFGTYCSAAKPRFLRNNMSSSIGLIRSPTVFIEICTDFETHRHDAMKEERYNIFQTYGSFSLLAVTPKLWLWVVYLLTRPQLEPRRVLGRSNCNCIPIVFLFEQMIKRVIKSTRRFLFWNIS